jgi:hypothetical protein
MLRFFFWIYNNVTLRLFQLFDECSCCCCRYKEQENAARLQVCYEKDCSNDYAEDSQIQNTFDQEQQQLVITDDDVEVHAAEVSAPNTCAAAELTQEST